MNQPSWDVIVAGGGMGAVAAAMAAAACGCRTILIERTGRLGGAYTTNLVQPLMGWSRHRHPLATRILAALDGDSPKLADLVLAEELLRSGATLLLHTWIAGAIREGDRVVGVMVLDKGGMREVRGGIVIDATGDGDVAASAGVPFEKGRDRDGLMQPMTAMYEIEGVVGDAFLCESEERAHALRWPAGSWHDIVMAGRQRGELPREVGIIRLYASPMPGRRVVNATQVNHVDGLRTADLTRAEIEGRRQARAVTMFLRRHAPGYAGCRIAEMPAAIGVRETRRFHGMTRVDIPMLAAGVRRRDAVVREVSFPVDIHNPDGVGQSEGIAATLPAYDLPYGCLVPATCDGLLLSGRNIAGSHEAHASYRVQMITLHIGIAAGTAAAACVRRGVQPRQLDPAVVQDALGLGGAG